MYGREFDPEPCVIIRDMVLDTQDKKDIKEIVESVFDVKLEPFVKAIQDDIGGVRQDIARLDKKIDYLDVKLDDDAAYTKGRMDIVERKLENRV